MHTAEEFNNLIIKEENDRIIRFSDIGRAELGPADIKSYMKMNGVPMVGIVVIPQPGANHIQDSRRSVRTHGEDAERPSRRREVFLRIR